MRRGRPPYPGLLTPREQDVLELLRRGLTNREIAGKLGVASRDEAAAWQGEGAVAGRRLPVRALAAPFVALEQLVAASPLNLVSAGAIGAGVVSVGLLAAGVLVMDARGNESSAGAPPPTEEPRDLGVLAYVSGGDVWTSQLPDGDPQLVAEHATGTYLAPSWSESGEWLSYELVLGEGTHDAGTLEEIREVWISKADGSGARKVEALAGTQAWSPTDDRLAYVSTEGDLVVEDPDGGSRRVLVAFDTQPGDTGARGLREPLWSPDGTRIAYGRGDRLEYQSIWSIVVDTGAAIELHAEETPPGKQGEPSGPLQPAAWAADGSLVYFWRAPIFSSSIQADGWPLWVATADGEASYDLGVQTLVYAEYLHSIPGSNQLLAVSGGGRDATRNKRLVVIDPVARSVRPLTREDMAASSLDTSAAAGRIVYAGGPDFQPQNYFTEPPDSRRVWLLYADGSQPERLTTQEEHGEEYPQWSRDGRSVLYVEPRLESNGPYSAALWIADADGDTRPKQVETISFGPQPGITPYYGHMNWYDVLDWWQP